MTKIVGEDEIASKWVSKRLVEIKHLKQLVSLDRVQVAISQCSDIGSRLSDRIVFPERVPKNIAFSCI